MTMRRLGSWLFLWLWMVPVSCAATWYTIAALRFVARFSVEGETNAVQAMTVAAVIVLAALWTLTIRHVIEFRRSLSDNAREEKALLREYRRRLKDARSGDPHDTGKARW